MSTVYLMLQYHGMTLQASQNISYFLNFTSGVHFCSKTWLQSLKNVLELPK
uniref:Uncharacterized protein n=1 Tax=Setaria italica TaxID=4555 RepID=K3ZZ18_SETIT